MLEMKNATLTKHRLSPYPLSWLYNENPQRYGIKKSIYEVLGNKQLYVLAGQHLNLSVQQPELIPTTVVVYDLQVNHM